MIGSRLTAAMLALLAAGEGLAGVGVERGAQAQRASIRVAANPVQAVPPQWAFSGNVSEKIGGWTPSPLATTPSPDSPGELTPPTSLPEILGEVQAHTDEKNEGASLQPIFALAGSQDEEQTERISARDSSRWDGGRALSSMLENGKALAFIGLHLLTAREKPPPPISHYLLEGVSYSVRSPRATLVDGSVIDGSTAFGGLQPPYRVDFSHPRVAELFSFVDSLHSQNLPAAELVSRITSHIRKLLPRKTYADPVYRALLKRHRMSGKAVDIGSYIEHRCGTCREHAILTHLALQRAGLKPKLAYVRVWNATARGKRFHEDHNINLLPSPQTPLIVDSYREAFHGKSLKNLMASEGTEDNSRIIRAGIVKDLDYPLIYNPATRATSPFAVRVKGDKEMTFSAEGRSAAERRFQLEEEQFHKASADESVTIEWFFLPYYTPLGHTALRIGRRAFEFTKEGWRIHASARAFLFNNPFFKHQYARHKENGMPPASFGLELKLPKNMIEKILTAIESERESVPNPFSLFFYNCNQAILAALQAAGAHLSQGALSDFSSIRTFRRLLLQPSVPTGKAYLYRLPSQAEPVLPLHTLIPDYLYRNHSIGRDFLRLIVRSRQFFQNSPSPSTM